MASDNGFLGVPGYWTLEDLALAGKVVMFECVHCGHTEILDIPELAKRHGPQTRVNYFKRNLPCRRCGRTGMQDEDAV